jgi:hypothetical protein
MVATQRRQRPEHCDAWRRGVIEIPINAHIQRVHTGLYQWGISFLAATALTWGGVAHADNIAIAADEINLYKLIGDWKCPTSLCES